VALGLSAQGRSGGFRVTAGGGGCPALVEQGHGLVDGGGRIGAGAGEGKDLQGGAHAADGELAMFAQRNGGDQLRVCLIQRVPFDWISRSGLTAEDTGAIRALLLERFAHLMPPLGVGRSGAVVSSGVGYSRVRSSQATALRWGMRETTVRSEYVN
jgi:hypothetical protein